MDKKEILDQLIGSVKKELESAEAASDSANSYKFDDDMKSEGKYDTRAIEAGYLAGAQAKRVEELKLELQLLEEIPNRTFAGSEEVAIGALVELSFNNRSQKYFVSSTAGGTLLNSSAGPVLVISVFSPIGSEMLGLKVGDDFELETPNETREYSILSIS